MNKKIILNIFLIIIVGTSKNIITQSDSTSIDFEIELQKAAPILFKKRVGREPKTKEINFFNQYDRFPVSVSEKDKIQSVNSHISLWKTLGKICIDDCSKYMFSTNQKK